VLDLMASPITGTEGNVEFLLHGRRAIAGDPGLPGAPDDLVGRAVADARLVREA
jgi:hypothetical protein